MKNARKIKSFMVLLLLTISFVPQKKSFAQIPGNDLTAAANFKAEEFISPETAIEITFSRALRTSEKIGLTIEQTDVSNLFSQIENRFVYDAKLLPLPIGNSTLTIFLIEPNGNWKEIVRLPLSVGSPDSRFQIANSKFQIPNSDVQAENTKTAKPEPSAATGGLPEIEKKPEEQKTADNGQTTEDQKPKTEAQQAETAKNRFFKFLPTFTIGMKSQPFQSNFPVDTRPAERAEFNDFTLTGSIKNEMKIGSFAGESSFDFAGSSFKPETLQFGALGREAPDVDLSSYLMNFQIGKAKFSLGHTSFGNNRHLVSSFSSRGLSVNIPINKFFDVTGGVLNGTSVLGFNIFFGVSKVRHQVQGGTLGIEFFPKRQNALRLEISGFNGYLQPLNNVSEGRIVDAEQSRGFGLRFLTSDKSERFKLEFGYALSRFFNPQDTTLDPDGNAVALPDVMRSAHYAEAGYQILKDVKITEKKNLNLNFAFKYEFIEPLYRSLGASASADKFTHDYAVDGSIGEITFQAGHIRSNDNLRNVPSILKLLTRADRFSVALPVAALFGVTENPSPFLPRIGYSVDRTHNFGAGIPVNGGFEIDLATIPDLLNTNQTFSSAWQFKKFNVEYTYNRSFADNRQTGSEKNDQLGWVHGFTVGVNPLEILSFNVGFNFESQRNYELDQINRTKTLNLGATWQMFKGASFTGNLSQVLAGDAARTVFNRNINYSGQFAYNFNIEKSRFRKFGMQAFARFADALTRNRDFVSVSNNLTRTKIMTAGMTFNFF